MKIYFILNSLTDAHSIRRVKDFSGIGADVKVFGFLRNKAAQVDDAFTVIGTFSNTLSYRKRVAIYFKGIKQLFKKYSDKDIVWYYLGLDVAWVATLLSPKKKYIYEECDLVHAYIHNKVIFNIFESLDKKIIKHSLFTITTSEGFIDFHYKNSVQQKPGNIVLAENKLSESILDIEQCPKTETDIKHLHFAFVGGLRYKSLLSLAEIIANNFPQLTFDFYGFIAPKFKEEELPKGKNIHYHGRFESPKDLPDIYSKVDVVVATYDVFTVNEKYAEPNKLYESIFFRCPIIVSSNTFLAEKVKRLGIGYDVDPYNKEKVINLVHDIETDLFKKVASINKIDTSYAIGNNNYAKNIVNSLNNNK